MFCVLLGHWSIGRRAMKEAMGVELGREVAALWSLAKFPSVATF